MRGNKSESERKEEAPTDTKSSTERPPPSMVARSVTACSCHPYEESLLQLQADDKRQTTNERLCGLL